MASSEEISQVLFTSEQSKKNKMVFFGILLQIKLLFGPVVIQLVWNNSPWFKDLCQPSTPDGVSERGTSYSNSYSRYEIVISAPSLETILRNHLSFQVREFPVGCFLYSAKMIHQQEIDYM